MNRTCILALILLATICAKADNWGHNADSLKQAEPALKPYKAMDDLTFAGIPIFVAGWATSGEKLAFATSNHEQTHKSTLFDDYSQFLSPAVAFSLKLAGYEGRSTWPRFLASTAMSYGIMYGVAESLKQSNKKMRPDGSTADSWPSGHTATSFVGATILHKEYGMTRSPWFSVLGYGMATATGVMRVIHNRHWASDVMAGAGIGIMSAETAYALSDILFKEKGILRNHLEDTPASPSFVGISMGLGIGGQKLCLGEGSGMAIEFRPATVADAEGAWFFNHYIGVGARLRVRAMSARSFGNLVDAPEACSDQLTEFTPSGGLYLNIPLNSRLSLGAKGLVGCSLMQDMNVSARIADASIDVLTLDAPCSASIATGVSLAYRHQSRFVWKAFLDYDMSKKNFTVQALQNSFETDKCMHYLTAGASFSINF